MPAQKPICTTNTNTQMALEQPHRTLGKVTTVFATKLKSFTFVPLLKRLPNEHRVTVNWKKALQTSWPNKTREPGDSEDIMADERVYKAEVIYIQDPEEGKFGETFKNGSRTQSEIQSTDNLTPNLQNTLVGPNTEFGSITPKPSPATMETIDNKHPGIPHLGFHNTSVGAEVSLGQFLNSTSQRDEVLSPANSMDFITSSASSKESIFSEGWDKDRSWPALHMLSHNGSPVSLSRTVSPCSSIRSGAFTPSVVQIKRHALAPGSSLMSSACGTPCCGSRATSPLSPHARHRPPPTQLSLLTAILRKGRLPVLSSTLQRHYTPCWPISPVNMSSCLACSAASAIAPMNMSKAKSCSSIDRSSSEPCQNSKPQPLKPDHSSLSMSLFAKASNEIPLQPPKRLDSWLHVTNNSIILPTKDSLLASPSLPTVKAASTHLSISGHKDNHLPTVPSPLSCTYFSHMRSLSPKSSSLSCCSPETTSVSGDHTASMDPNNYFANFKLYDEPKQSQKTSYLSAEPSLKHTGRSSDHLSSLIPKATHNSHKSCSPSLKYTVASCDNSASPVLNHSENRPGTLLQNASKSDAERVHLSSPAFTLSPSPRTLGLTHQSFTPPASSPCPSAYPNSRSSTPECCILSPSPAALSRQLSPSPSYSLSSSPSPSLWGSTPDCADRDDKNRKPHKLKSTYKAIAAIPTNTLLQEQQAIDDEVNKNEPLVNPADNYTWEDPHSKMCSPAQLRQQSDELYAAIDEVLEGPIKRRQKHHVNKTPALGEEAPRPQTSTPSPKQVGRETKYANFHCQPCLPTEKTQTKPGIIRPVHITSRLTDDKDDEEFHPNPFKSYKGNTSSRYQYKFVRNPLLNESKADGRGAPDWHCTDGEEQGDSKSSLASLITQTRSSQQDVPISIHTHETHI